ncbi:MAG TPA: LUD domain-containing protein, partial [Gammaproteobacteria bacterium]
VLSRADFADTLLEILRRHGLAAGMPTNVLLISGPSKTADIEQTLVYGVHGPKQLIVLLTE